MNEIPSPFPINSISFNVYTALKKDILDGTLGPGERLIVLDIAGKYQISQAPVREALERLKQEGLIVGQPNKGSVVSDITSKEIRDIFILREMIEGFAVKESMPLLTEDDFRYLEHVLQEMDQAVKEYDSLKILEKDMEFHGFFYRKCNNSAILELWNHMKTKVMRFMAISNRHYSTKKLVDWHKPLLEAIKSGNPAEAEAKVIEHMHSYKTIHLD
ncbi:GntR family transcriptional regulator [Paenibacillus tarimensis]